MPQHRSSPKQYLARARDCDDDELRPVLAQIRHEYGGMSGRLLCMLLAKRKMLLADAWHLLRECGHTPHHGHLSMIEAMTPLVLADFELILSMWPKLTDLERNAPGVTGSNLPRLVQGWAGVRFIQYWQSPAGGAALTPDALQRLRPIWEPVSPTQAQRLAPERACGLGWGAQQTVSLVSSIVDTNGAAEALVRELLERAILTPALVNEHQGLVGGLLRVRPQWVAERLLSGEITLVKPQPTIARLVAEALAAWAERSGGALSVQNVHHLVKFVDELAQLAPATNAMCAVELVPSERLP